VGRAKGSWAVAARPNGVTLRRHLSEILGREVRLSISVGPPRPNRKPVIRCYSADGLTAVAKLGPDPHTEQMVINEAQWLDVLAVEPLTGVITPPLIHAGRYGEGELLVMGALDLASDLGIGFGEVPVEIAREFSDRYRDNERIVDTKWWHDLRHRVDNPHLASVSWQVFRAEEHPMFDDIQISAWHGDWSPWNMGMSRSGKLCIWDWERTLTGVPVGFDLLHLHYQYGSGLDGADDDLTHLGVPPEQHRLLKCLYLFEVCARHADAGVLGGKRHANAIVALDVLAGSVGTK